MDRRRRRVTPGLRALRTHAKAAEHARGQPPWNYTLLCLPPGLDNPLPAALFTIPRNSIAQRLPQ